MHTQNINFTSRIKNNSKRAEKYTDRADYSAFCIEKSKKAKVAACAFVGATLPLILINSFKKGNVSEIVNGFKNKLPIKQNLKSIWKLFEIKNLGQVLATTTGGVLAGTLAGVKGVKSKRERKAKYKEGVFQFANSMLPATFVTLGLSSLKKTSKAGSIPIKAGVIISSLVAGMFAANKVSNKINNEVFERNRKNKEQRSFKPKDIVSQFDDLGYVAVLTGLPIVSKLQIDKFLPLLYTKMGYEAGNAKKHTLNTTRA